MEWKTFGIKRKLISVRERAFRVVRLISGLRKGNSNVSSPTSVLAVAPYEPVNSVTISSLEAELKRAQALAYWRMWDRGK